MKILIAVPCMDMLHQKFAESLVNVTRTAPADTDICWKPSSLIYDSRNLLALTAIENGYDRIMWFDSDMTFPPDTLHRLLTVMDHGYDVVSGMYVRRKPPVIPVIYKRIDAPAPGETDIANCVEDYLDYKPGTIFRIDGCGLGCALMKTSLVKRVWETYGPPFSPLAWTGEDLSFCYRAKQLGAKMVCDSSVRCGHIGSVLYTDEIFLKQRGDAIAKE